MTDALTCPVCSEAFDESIVKGKAGTLADGRNFVAIAVTCPQCKTEFTFSQRVDGQPEVTTKGQRELE